MPFIQWSLGRDTFVQVELQKGAFTLGTMSTSIRNMLGEAFMGIHAVSRQQ
jgi:hypothetical protein